MPPFDRTIALACSMRTLRGRWLHVRCACGWSSPKPIRAMLIAGDVRPDQTLADAVVMTRCGNDRCHDRRKVRMHLCETVWGTSPPGKDIGWREPGWAILLHDGVGEPDAAPAVARAAE